MTTTDDRPTFTLENLPDPGEAWLEHAACIGADPKLFTIGKGHTEPHAGAVKLCYSCEVSEPCLLVALRSRDEVTYRGAMTPKQRKRWLKRKSIAQPESPKTAVRGRVASGDIVRMALNGWAAPAIAAHLGCSVATAGRRLKAARAEGLIP